MIGPMFRERYDSYQSERPMREETPITFWLIAINAAIYVLVSLGASDPARVLNEWGLVPARLVHGATGEALLTVLTSMFLHGGLMHVLGNLLFLSLFGRIAEAELGSRRFGWAYLLSGVGAAIAQIAVDPSSFVPMVGASGAISGALGAAVVLAPRQRIVFMTPFLLFIPISMSVLAFGAVWFGMQLLGAFGDDGVGGGIAFWAHVGGFVTGFLLTSRWTSALATWRSAQARPRPGPAPNPDYRVFYVTDGSGRTFMFHERA